MPINCIVVDDEPLAVGLLQQHIAKIASFHLVGTALNALKAAEMLRKYRVDLIFLDIQMPELDGISFLKSLYNKPHVIFTTAYREFGPEGFELEAVDYLLKPITFERFFKAADRVLRIMKVPKEESHILVKAGGMQHRLALRDILYVESQGNEVKIILQNNRTLQAKHPISELEITLQDKNFIRIHRSFIINPQQISAFNYNSLMLGEHCIPVGRTYRENYDSLISRNFQSNNDL